jgi:transcriptional regulator of met regulon
MEDFPFVAVLQTAQELKEKQTNVPHVKNIGTVVHVLLQVLLDVFKHERQRRSIEDNVIETDDIIMSETFQKAHFAQGRTGRT